MYKQSEVWSPQREQLQLMIYDEAITLNLHLGEFVHSCNQEHAQSTSKVL